MRRLMFSTLALVAMALPAAAQERICSRPLRAEFIAPNDPRGEKFSQYIAENCKANDVLLLNADDFTLMLRHCDLSRTVFGHSRGQGGVICSIQNPPRTEMIPLPPLTPGR